MIAYNIFTPVLRRGKNGSRHIDEALAALRMMPGPLTVATLPAAASVPLTLVFVSNGAAGQPCLAFSDGNVWHQVALGAAVSAV